MLATEFLQTKYSQYKWRILSGGQVKRKGTPSPSDKLRAGHPALSKVASIIITIITCHEGTERE
jgi:hypothetical protein